VANNIVELGSSTLANGAGSFEISVVVPSSAFSLTKQYLIPVNYNETTNAWHIVNPITEGGPFVSEDFTLEINVNLSVVSFRIRRTTGTTAGTAYVSLKINGNAPTFTESSGTASVTAPSVYYNGAIITQKDGAATINGNLTATQLIRSGGTSSQFLKADGSIDSTTYATSGANSNITSLSGLTTALSATQGGTAQSTYATGDILYASASNTLSKRTVGSTGQVLVVSGGVPTWGAVSGTPIADPTEPASPIDGQIWVDTDAASTIATDDFAIMMLMGAF
jgi:hypothetical protein